MVQSFGAVARKGANGGFGTDSGNRVEVFPALNHGFFAIFSAAASVLVGAMAPGGVAAANNEVQVADGDEPTLGVFTHAAIMFASVLISACGTTAFPVGVFANATPVEKLVKFRNAEIA